MAVNLRGTSIKNTTNWHESIGTHEVRRKLLGLGGYYETTIQRKDKRKLEKYQPTHVEKGLKCERCGSEYDLYKFAPTKNTRMVTSIKTVANVKSMRNISETSNGR